MIRLSEFLDILDLPESRLCDLTVNNTTVTKTFRTIKKEAPPDTLIVEKYTFGNIRSGEHPVIISKTIQNYSEGIKEAVANFSEGVKEGSKCYLSGPISGVDNYLDVFAYYEGIIARKYNISVINPAKSSATLPQDTKYWEYIDKDLELMRMCNGIILLPGWEKSTGAQFEYSYAQIRNMDIYLAFKNGCVLRASD